VEEEEQQQADDDYVAISLYYIDGPVNSVEVCLVKFLFFFFFTC
jgi:hypothetical protein